MGGRQYWEKGGIWKGGIGRDDCNSRRRRLEVLGRKVVELQ